VAALAAAVPEAPIDEYCDPFLNEEEIRPSRKIPVVHRPAAYASSHEFEAEFYFGRPIAAASHS
jgi:hypothetical protein